MNYVVHYIKDFFEQEHKEPQRFSAIYLWVGIPLLMFCGLRIYSGLESHMDIQFADEAAYMRFGLDLPTRLNRDWGPLYAIWYKALSFITSDTIKLYYLNFRLTALLPPVLILIFLWRLGVNVLLSLFITYCIMVSNANISVWPRISQFCLIILLSGLIGTTFTSNKIYKLLIMALVCLLCSYARPEFYLAFLLFMCFLAVAFYFLRSTITRKTIVTLLFFLITVVSLHLFFRFPSNDFFGYNRGVAAFYQHYAFNLRLQGKQEDAWLNWEDIAKSTFGDCNSMWCVIKTKPAIFIQNTLYNIKNFVFFSAILLFSYVFPLIIFQGNKLKALIIFFILSLIIIILFSNKRRQLIKAQFLEYRFYILSLFLFIAPTLLSCVFVFPREHYFYLQMLFFVMLWISILQPVVQMIPKQHFVFAVLVGACFLLSPAYSNYPFLTMDQTNSSLCNKKMIQYLEQNYANEPHTLFTNMPFVRGMLPRNFKEINTIFDKKKQIPFSHYADSAQIDIVIINPSLLRDPHVKNDSSWQRFLHDPSLQGFQKINFSKCDMYLWVKEN